MTFWIIKSNRNGAYFTGLGGNEGGTSIHQADATRYPAREQAVAVRRKWAERSAWNVVRVGGRESPKDEGDTDEESKVGP